MIIQWSQCLKITENVSFNIASEASYVYILSGQNLIKNAKNGPFWKPEVCGQIVLPDRSILIMESAKIPNATFWVIFKHCDSNSGLYYYVGNGILKKCQN